MRKVEPRTRPRVLLVQNAWVHYRLRMAEHLLADSSIDFTLAHSEGHPLSQGPSGIQPAVGLPNSRLVDLGLRSFGRWSLQPRLFCMALSGKFDAVICQGDFRNLSVWLVLALRRTLWRKGRVLLWTQGWNHADSPPRSCLKRFFFGLADALLLYSDRGLELGKSRVRRSLCLYVVGNSLNQVDDMDLHERGQTFNPVHEAGLIRIGVITRLIRQRRLHELLEALQHLEAEGLDYRVTVVGEGEERGSLEAQCQREGLSVKFLGALYEEARISELFLDCDLSVVTGPAGLAVATSLANGCPVVIHGDMSEHMPEASAIEPGFTGEFYRKEDSADLAEKILLVWGKRQEGCYSADQCRASAEANFSPARHASRVSTATKAVLSGVTGSRVRMHDLG